MEKKCETPDSPHPGREKKIRGFFAQLPIGRQNHSSTMNIHHSSTMIPGFGRTVRSWWNLPRQMDIYIMDHNGLMDIYIYIMVWNHRFQPFIHHEHPGYPAISAEDIAVPWFFIAALLASISVGAPMENEPGECKLFHHLPSTWRINQFKTIDTNLDNIDNNWLMIKLFQICYLYIWCQWL